MEMIFHARESATSATKTHTLFFARKDNELYLTWAKPLTNVGIMYDTGSNKIPLKADSYSRKDGVNICKKRMSKFISNIPTVKARHNDIEGLNEFLHRNLPSAVAKTLPYYTEIATRYFKIEGTSKKLLNVRCRQIIEDMRNPIIKESISTHMEIPIKSIMELCAKNEAKFEIKKFNRNKIEQEKSDRRLKFNTKKEHFKEMNTKVNEMEALS